MADSLKARVGRVVAGSLHALLDRLEDLHPQAAMEQAALVRELARTRRQVVQLEQRVAQLQRPSWRRAASR